MFKMLRLLLNICILTLIVHAIEDAPEVTVKHGTLRGGYRKTWKGRQIQAFTGIPYAKPPVGELRFKAPLPGEPWNGILDASKAHPVCPQPGGAGITGKEDCLYLNVYVPPLETVSNEPLPVMVFIHGGAFSFGSANPNHWGPDILLDQDVILVTINYRLGALGFLSMVDDVLPGNIGFKDQTLALKWIKNNIAAFGGDPSKITIFGESAGGASVHYHVLSPASQGLFSAAISQSGVATLTLSLAPKNQAVKNAKKLAQLLKCPTDSSQQMIDCLKTVKAEDIVAQQGKFYEWQSSPLIPFKPVIEPNVEGAFLIENPVDTIKSGKFAKVPFMMGLTLEDGAVQSAKFYNNPTATIELNNDFNRIAPLVFQYDELVTDRDDASQQIRSFYFGNRTIDNSTKSEATEMMTDAWFMAPLSFSGELHTKYSNQTVFYYLFGVHGSASFGHYYGDASHDYGVAHGDELVYLLSGELFPHYKPNATELRINDIMTTLWANFARTGNPTPEINELIRTKWESVESGMPKYYFIQSDNNITMIEDPYTERKNFWINLKIDAFTRKGL